MSRFSKMTEIIICVTLASILLLSLPVLCVFINAAVIGSLEAFPTPEQIEKGRIGYSLLSLLIIALDAVLLAVIIKLTGKKSER
jgi:hypothetical protein